MRAVSHIPSFAAQQLPASTCRSHVAGLCICAELLTCSCSCFAHALQLSGTLYANSSLKRNHHHERASATALLLHPDDCSVSVQLSQVRQQSACVRSKYIVDRCAATAATAALYLAAHVVQRCIPLGVCAPDMIVNGSRLAAGDHSLASRTAAIHTTALPCSESLQHADSPCLQAGRSSAGSALELSLSLNADQHLVSV